MTQDSLWADTHDLAPIFRRIQERHYPLMEDVEAIERICQERDESFMWMEEKLARVEQECEDYSAGVETWAEWGRAMESGRNQAREETYLALERIRGLETALEQTGEKLRQCHRNLVDLQGRMEDALSLAPENVERLALEAFAAHYWPDTSGVEAHVVQIAWAEAKDADSATHWIYTQLVDYLEIVLHQLRQELGLGVEQARQE